MKESNKMFLLLVCISLMCDVSSGSRFKSSRSMKSPGGSIINKFLPQLSRKSASGSYKPCTSPSPVSIAPCECSEDYLYGRQLACYFDFDQNDDVTETTHNLFKNFNASNNQFDLAYFEFSNDGESSNFMFDYATSGHLEVKVFEVYNIHVENGMLPMSESALLGSINSLEALIIGNDDESYTKLAFSENFLFAMGLLNLKTLGLRSFDWNKFQIPEETVLMLESLAVDIKLEALPEMPNLKQLAVGPREETSLTSEVLKKMPNLKVLYIDVEYLGGKLDPILPGTFEGSKSLEWIDLSYTNITSIDLSGLGPSTVVGLVSSSIRNLPELNFRSFLEGAVRNYISVSELERLSGGIYLYDNPLECSCDFKWLCDVPGATDLLYDAECADGTTLESAMEVICNQC